VTGGTSGIGLAISHRLLSDGMQVVSLSRNPGGKNEPGFLKIKTDLREPDEIEHSIKDVLKELGTSSVDVLVNNAGISGPIGPIQDISLVDWDETLKVNVTAAFLCCKLVVPYMIRAGKGGRIINIASMAGKKSAPFRASYLASKMALIGLTKSLAPELGRYNITVNAISPGPVEGERMNRIIEAGAKIRNTSPSNVREGFLRSSAIGRFSKPQEIASLVSFLASEEAANISGQDLYATSD
jgi:NAD(P)-dependent dehydrogenase (short-subunit alcohol dehydrogenase family)